MVENVVLKWDTFNSNLADLFKDLISSKTFSDLTLFSDDGVKFTAHKILLSSFSPVFRNMLEINSNQTIIYLRGIQSREFQHILQFMYTGEAVIEKDNMEEFLNVAKSLQVKNLCNNLQTVHCKKDEETIQEFASREGVFRRKYLCKFCDYRPSKRQHLIFHYKLGFQIDNQKFYDNFMNFMKTLKSEWTITSRKKGNARKESCVVLKVMVSHQNGERFHPSIHNLVCSETNC